MTCWSFTEIRLFEPYARKESKRNMDLDIAIMMYPAMAISMPHLPVFLDIKNPKANKEYMTVEEIKKDVKEEVCVCVRARLCLCLSVCESMVVMMCVCMSVWVRV
jgi:predicted nucleotidyltransferase